MYTYTHENMYMHTAYMYRCMHVCVHVCLYVCMYVRMYVCAPKLLLHRSFRFPPGRLQRRRQLVAGAEDPRQVGPQGAMQRMKSLAVTSGGLMGSKVLMAAPGYEWRSTGRQCGYDSSGVRDSEPGAELEGPDERRVHVLSAPPKSDLPKWGKFMKGMYHNLNQNLL